MGGWPRLKSSIFDRCNVDPDHGVALLGQTSRGDRADVAQAKHADFS
jgi:hypothetical protein